MLSPVSHKMIQALILSGGASMKEDVCELTFQDSFGPLS